MARAWEACQPLIEVERGQSTACLTRSNPDHRPLFMLYMGPYDNYYGMQEQSTEYVQILLLLKNRAMKKIKHHSAA
ncbi:hypothetical protein DUT91_04670 [Phyllobacterium salinisoli]|uniref:Uncharacterized protein n=1 Tax=Phyllobacterium salinisoli TaxID=1899321 RepID=A0A368K6C5_9HYPH|nr:hypothetical protein DUT91_04670 [Phyllobacterium salinisoli]